VLSDSREGRRKKEPEKPDPRAFERFETLARKIVPPAKPLRKPKPTPKKR
jgi:hypothetical protein